MLKRFASIVTLCAVAAWCATRPSDYVQNWPWNFLHRANDLAAANHFDGVPYIEALREGRWYHTRRDRIPLYFDEEPRIRDRVDAWHGGLDCDFAWAALSNDAPIVPPPDMPTLRWSPNAPDWADEWVHVTPFPSDHDWSAALFPESGALHTIHLCAPYWSDETNRRLRAALATPETYIIESRLWFALWSRPALIAGYADLN